MFRRYVLLPSLLLEQCTVRHQKNKVCQPLTVLELASSIVWPVVFPVMGPQTLRLEDLPGTPDTESDQE